MGRDKRGIDRGACKVCECDEYEVTSSDRIVCEYCDHSPMAHYTRELKRSNLAVMSAGSTEYSGKRYKLEEVQA